MHLYCYHFPAVLISKMGLINLLPHPQRLTIIRFIGYIYLIYLSFNSDFQDHIDSLSASWRLDGDPCPFTEKQWSVYRFDEEVIQDMQDLPEGKSIITEFS